MLVFEILKAILLEVCLERCVGLVKEFAVTDDGLIWRPSVSALSASVRDSDFRIGHMHSGWMCW